MMERSDPLQEVPAESWQLLQDDAAENSDDKCGKIVTHAGGAEDQEVKDSQNVGKQNKNKINIYSCKPETSVCYFLPEPVKKKWKELWSWFWGDMSKTHLIWIKLIFFFQSASLVVLYPYLVIHMRSLGLSVEEVAVVNGVIPVADVVGPPMAGFLADKIGNFRVFMSVLTAVSGGASLLLLLIPPKTHHTLSPGTLFCCSDDSGTPGTTWCSNTAANISYQAHLATNTTMVCSNELHVLHISQLSPHNNINKSNNMEFSESCMELECNGEVESVDPSWEMNLIFYIILRAAIDVLRASSIMMFEGAVVITIKQLGGDYGLQKLFGTFGAIIWGPVSGQIIDMASSASGTENYAPVFYIFFAMRIICALLVLKLNLSFKKPAERIFKDLGKLIMKPHIFMFLIIFFMCGSIWGFLESYLFWFLEDLGSTKLTMGISLAVGTIAGIPLTIASGAIIKMLGNTNVITLALFIYSFRLLGYSFINLPLESLVFEIFKPFGNSLLMIAAMTYAKNNADISTMASLEGVMGALYFGIGKSLGSLVGGLAIDEIGVRNTFRCFSVIALVSASVYLLFTLIRENRGVKLKDIEDKIMDTEDEEKKKKKVEVLSEDNGLCKEKNDISPVGNQTNEINETSRST